MDLPPDRNTPGGIKTSGKQTSGKKTSCGSIAAIVFLVLVGAGFLNQAISALNPNSAPERVESAVPEDGESIEIPNLEGLIASDAETALAELGFENESINSQDASAENRTVIDRSNWFVCGTRPESGSTANFGQSVVILVVKNNEVCPGTSGTETGTSESGDGTVASSEFGPQPSEQIEMIELIEFYRVAYDEAQTDLQKANSRLERDEAICQALGSGKVSNWYGVVDDVGATSEALGWLKIAIGDNVTLETWNNEFSDIGDDTLVSRKSPLYETLLSLTKGQVVKFSGKFVADSGLCLGTKNLTEHFAINRPEFPFKFTSLVLD